MRRLLVVGCADAASRMCAPVPHRYAMYALTRDRARTPMLRALGLTPVQGHLDRPDTLAVLGVLAGLAQDVVHFAPPPSTRTRDARTAHLITALAKGKSLPQHLVYLSTSEGKA